MLRLKRVFGVLLLCFSLVLAAYHPADAAGTCDQYKGVTKIWWDGMELKKGQIGRLTIVKDTPLFKLDGEKRVISRTLKKGEFYRIYAFKPGMLSVGGGYFVDRDYRVTYQTPSKEKLNAVACINGGEVVSAPAVPKVYTTKEIVDLNDEKIVLIQTDRALGSGIVLGNGLVLTNHHVMSGATEATVTFSNGKKYKVQGIVEANPGKDIAIIKTVNTYPVAGVALRTSSTGLSKGEKVVAIGSPLGLQNTVSEGIISAFRNMDGIKLIQTNADIDNGSSGGGLFNTNGQLIGITSSGFDSNSANLNFAIAPEEYMPLVKKYLTQSHRSITASFPIPSPGDFGFDPTKIYDFEYILTTMNDHYSSIYTDKVNLPISFEDMYREDDNSIYLQAVVNIDNYIEFLENYDLYETEAEKWGYNMGGLLDVLYPKENVYMGVWFVEEFDEQPSEFPAEDIEMIDGKWVVVHNIIWISLEENITVDVQP